MRWFDLVQNVAVKKADLTKELPLLEVDLDDVPEPVVAAPVSEENAGDV